MSVMSNTQVKLLAAVLILGSYIMAALAGLWWLDNGDQIELGIYILVIYVLTYEFGFKICYQRMSKLCFLLGFLLPATFATLGFSIGFFIK